MFIAKCFIFIFYIIFNNLNSLFLRKANYGKYEKY